MPKLAFDSTLMASSYAIQYAREHNRRASFAIESEDPLGLSDWWYLSVQVSATFSPSDVRPITARARRMVTVHTEIAFAFYAIVVALTVSLLSSRLS